jgi:hypothetical protein
MNVMTVGGDAMQRALTDYLGYMGQQLAGNCGCGWAKWCWHQRRIAMGKICACRLGSLQGRVVGVADCCERALGLQWKEKT